MDDGTLNDARPLTYFHPTRLPRLDMTIWQVLP